MLQVLISAKGIEWKTRENELRKYSEFFSEIGESVPEDKATREHVPKDLV